MAYPIEAPGPFGLCVMTESMDVIFYQQETTRAHQDHIILHEVGHMIAGHGGEQAWPPEDLTGAGPGGPALWLQRTCYDSAHEREAELIATIILERAALLDPADTLGPVPPPEDHALTRIRRALTHQSNWL
ncbi:hypothetical protein ACIRU3_23055 [Streptomyces sp. NPDC101151]|uniref:hypothetical protein n=1 Tax=Streptomyces sp. NPDC101151 TaxID=3366115 RepID=UPI003830894C